MLDDWLCLVMRKLLEDNANEESKESVFRIVYSSKGVPFLFGLKMGK